MESVAISIETKVNLNEPQDPIGRSLRIHNIRLDQELRIQLSPSKFIQEKDMIGFITEAKNEVNYLKTDSEKASSINRLIVWLPKA